MKSLMHRFVSRRGRVAAFALLGVALSACSANWQSFGFDAAQTRFTTETANPSTLAARWTATLGGPSESTPAVVDGTVYWGTGYHTQTFPPPLGYYGESNKLYAFSLPENEDD